MASCLKLPEQKPKGPVKKIKVHLPPKPNLNIKHPPVKYVDGSYSVEGLLNNAGKLKGQVVSLSGYVVAHNLCPQNEEVECTIEPSLLLADYTKGHSKKIRVFVRPGEEGRLNDFQVGQKVKLSGSISMVSPKGTVVEMDGLFVMAPSLAKDTAGEDKKAIQKKAKNRAPGKKKRKR